MGPTAHAAIAEAFIRKGADINIRNAVGLGPLHAAIERSGTDASSGQVATRIAELLITDGSKALQVNNRSKQGDTALQLAVARDNLSVCQLLCQHPDIDPNKESCSKMLPLHAAIANVAHQFARAEAITLAILSCGKADINKADGDGQRPLFLAVQVAKSTQILGKLLATTTPAKVDLEVNDSGGCTILHRAMYMACMSGDQAAAHRARMLLQGSNAAGCICIPLGSRGDSNTWID